jgi:hypothetical protein
MAAVGLFSQPPSAFLHREVAEGFPRRELVPLALAYPTDTPGSEDGLEILALSLVGGHNQKVEIAASHGGLAAETSPEDFDQGNPGIRQPDGESDEDGWD